MEKVARLLDIAFPRLIARVGDMMEYHHDNNHAIHFLCNEAETVTFPIDWNTFLLHIQHRLFVTTFSQYKTCCRGLPQK